METIETIIQIVIYIPLFAFVILVLLLLRKVQEYRDEVEYLKSVCEQVVKISEQTEKKLNEHITQNKRSHKQSFIIGYEKGKQRWK